MVVYESDTSDLEFFAKEKNMLTEKQDDMNGPVIFLDFDGVLNSRHYRHSGLGVFLVSDRTLDELIVLPPERYQ